MQGLSWNGTDRECSEKVSLVMMETDQAEVENVLRMAKELVDFLAMCHRLFILMKHSREKTQASTEGLFDFVGPICSPPLGALGLTFFPFTNLRVRSIYLFLLLANAVSDYTW